MLGSGVGLRAAARADTGVPAPFRTDLVRFTLVLAVPVAEVEVVGWEAAILDGLLLGVPELAPLLFALEFVFVFADTFLAVLVLPLAVPPAPGGFLGVVVDIVAKCKLRDLKDCCPGVMRLLIGDYEQYSRRARYGHLMQ
jgi:hypothetical protein